MALDKDLHRADSESGEVWAPLHAWRALGQLRAESAIEPLLQLLDRIDDDDDDWAQGDLPKVFGMIGPAIIPGLRIGKQASHKANKKKKTKRKRAKAARKRNRRR